MSLGVKTANGDVKIHSVHVVPADGYMSYHDIAEGIELNSTTNASYIPYLIHLKDVNGVKDAVYFRSSPDYKNSLQLVAKEFVNSVKIRCSVYLRNVGTSFETRSNSLPSLYPNTENTRYNGIECTTNEGSELKLYRENINNIHPAILNKYGSYGNNWIPYNDMVVPFTDVFVLNGLLATDNVIFVHWPSGYWIIPFRDYVPTFEYVSGSGADAEYRVIGNPNVTSYKMGTSPVGNNAIYSDKYAFNSGTTTFTVAVDDFLASTFDIKLSDNTVLYAKNADTTDFVATM